jgi:hypothetical protein
MRKILSTIVLASAALLPSGCVFVQTKGSEKSDTTNIITDEILEEYTELKKVPMPCSKELFYNAWRQIGTIESVRGKKLDYKQNTPALYISTDLDNDGNPEILLRSQPPYAAIFTVIEDSIRLITYVEQAQIGLSITPDGVIIRNGRNPDGSTILSEFIKLENSQIAAAGETLEKYSIQGNEWISAGTEYKLLKDSVMAKANKEEYLKVAPKQNGTYLEDIEGWEDFRKP